MPASILQEAQSAAPSGTSATTVVSNALGSNATIGSTIEAYIVWLNGSQTAPTSVKDSANQTYTLQNHTWDGGFNGFNVSLYTFVNNQSATKLTVTATWAAGQMYRGCWVKEVGDTNAVQTAGGNYTFGPGTGTNAYTTGSLTPTSANALLSCLCQSTSSGTVADTSATSGQSAWGTTVYGISESYYLTSTAAKAGHFTNSTNGGSDSPIVIGAIYTEGGGGSVVTTPLPQRIWVLP
jgi:hypothetical protein